ncbi:MAG: molybdenum cofactor guanylyltransferase MobA [Magnetococcales bacterium]|nr:molybdenum cofactor guanylyltransferase MobA [Magnetococcales bacterium]
MSGINPATVPGMILAGGLSRRMSGQEKAFLDLGGKTLLARTLASLQEQVTVWAINANGDASRFTACGIQVIPDRRPEFLGPLAGIETALALVTAPWVFVVPIDLPFLPGNLVQELCVAAKDATRPVTVASGGRLHPTVGLWPRQLLPQVTQALDAGRLAMGEWFAHHPHRVVEFPCREDTPDPFFNINTPDDLVMAHRWLERGFSGS